MRIYLLVSYSLLKTEVHYLLFLLFRNFFAVNGLMLSFLALNTCSLVLVLSSAHGLGL